MEKALVNLWGDEKIFGFIFYSVTHVTQKGKIRHEDSKAQWFHQEKHKLCEDFVSLCLSG